MKVTAQTNPGWTTTSRTLHNCALPPEWEDEDSFSLSIQFAPLPISFRREQLATLAALGLAAATTAAVGTAAPLSLTSLMKGTPIALAAAAASELCEDREIKPAFATGGFILALAGGAILGGNILKLTLAALPAGLGIAAGLTTHYALTELSAERALSKDIRAFKERIGPELAAGLHQSSPHWSGSFEFIGDREKASELLSRVDVGTTSGQTLKSRDPRPVIFSWSGDWNPLLFAQEVEALSELEPSLLEVEFQEDELIVGNQILKLGNDRC